MTLKCVRTHTDRRSTFDFMSDVTVNNLLDFVSGINKTIIAFIFEGLTHTYRICAVLTLYAHIMRFCIYFE